MEKLDDLRISYEQCHVTHKISVEKKFNKNLANMVKKEQTKIFKYKILINTSIKKKFINSINKINIDEENQKMNKFLYEKLGVQYTNYKDGYLYEFDDFSDIDNVLDILFKIMKSSLPLDCKICVQIGGSLEELENLAKADIIGKIIMCADTVLRYKCNKSHRYGTHCIGVYQKENGTMELHEFHEIL